MTTTLSTKGQVALPEAVRTKLGLRPGARFDCLVRKGQIVLTPKVKPRKARIIKSKLTGLPVLVPPPDAPPLTPEAVRLALSDFP